MNHHFNTIDSSWRNARLGKISLYKFNFRTCRQILTRTSRQVVDYPNGISSRNESINNV
jgi:hypothetical protein